MIQFRYGEDGLAGEHVEFQSLKTVKLSNAAFEKKFKFDPTNERYVRRLFSDEVLKDMVGSSEVVAEIEREWEQLKKDREALRQVRLRRMFGFDSLNFDAKLFVFGTKVFATKCISAYKQAMFFSRSSPLATIRSCSRATSRG